MRFTVALLAAVIGVAAMVAAIVYGALVNLAMGMLFIMALAILG